MRGDGRRAEALDYSIRALRESWRMGTWPFALATMLETAGLLLEMEQPGWAAELLAHVESCGNSGMSQVAEASDLLETRVRLLLTPEEYDTLTRDGRASETGALIERLARLTGGPSDQPNL